MNKNNRYSKFPVLIFMIMLISACGKNESPEEIDSFFLDVNYKITEYDGIPIEMKTLLFTDEFRNNLNGWPEQTTETFSCEIKDDNYNLASLGSEIRLFYNNSILLPENFEIEIQMTILEGDQGSVQEGGICWGDYNMFGVRRDGYYYCYNTQYSILETPDPNIINGTNSYNVLTVRKFGTQYCYFINQKLVQRSEFVPIGGSTGFYVNPYTSVKVEYMKVYQLTTK